MWVHEQQIEEADSLELRMLDLDPQDIVETPEHHHGTSARNGTRVQQLPLTPQPAPAASDQEQRPSRSRSVRHAGRLRGLLRRLRRRNRP